MRGLDFIKGVDIYLLDQILKGNLDKESVVLDAGFGSGRNLRFCINQGFDVTAIDQNTFNIWVGTCFINQRSKSLHCIHSDRILLFRIMKFQFEKSFVRFSASVDKTCWIEV